MGALSDFENHLASLNIKSFLADYSVESPPSSGRVTFDKKFVGACDTENSFTLESWKNKYLPGYGGDLLLQMDIEGSEYEAIIGAPLQILDAFRIMVIEFHFMEKMFDPIRVRTLPGMFRKNLAQVSCRAHPSKQLLRQLKQERHGDTQSDGVHLLQQETRGRDTAKKRFPASPGPGQRARSGPLPLPRCWYQ